MGMDWESIIIPCGGRVDDGKDTGKRKRKRINRLPTTHLPTKHHDGILDMALWSTLGMTSSTTVGPRLRLEESSTS